jgi:hypothetical protein
MLEKNLKMVRFCPMYYYFIIHLIFVLSLSYQKTKSDKSFSKTELYKKSWLKKWQKTTSGPRNRYMYVLLIRARSYESK